MQVDCGQVPFMLYLLFRKTVLANDMEESAKKEQESSPEGQKAAAEAGGLARLKRPSRCLLISVSSTTPCSSRKRRTFSSRARVSSDLRRQQRHWQDH